jgi:glycosyltransferase involved in cell wall biosynthesis
VVGTDPGGAGRLMVVSSPASVAANQQVYVALQEHGWEVHLRIPRVWRDLLDWRPYETRLVPALRARGRRLGTRLSGHPQRHFYVGALAAEVRAIRPHAAFVEEETFAAAAVQWSRVLARAGVPFGVQADENLDRRLPPPAPAFRRFVLRRAGFVAARSPRAASLLGTAARTELVPHPVVEWPVAPRGDERPPTIGFAGRLVAEKGVRDLLEAHAGLPGARLLVVGDGELRDEVAAAARRTGRIELLTDVRHDAMPAVYRRMDVLALPSRTTATWAEQFGRVLVEAMWCGVPVVGSDSGEIPWVIDSTGGGVVVPEGDVPALRDALGGLLADPARRDRLATRGREAVAARFTVSAVAGALDRALRAIAGASVPGLAAPGSRVSRPSGRAPGRG